MKGCILCVIFVSLAASAWAAEPETPAAGEPEIQVVEEIIAKVNGQIITHNDLAKERQNILEGLQQQKLQGQQLEEAFKEQEQFLLQNRIDHLLLVERGKQLDINVEKDVSKYLAQIMLNLKVADQEELAQIITRESGMSFVDFRAEVENGILKERVVSQEVGSKVIISQEEIAKYYEEHKDDFIREERIFLSEILISTTGKDADGIAAAEEKANALVARARRGQEFAELARENSDAQSKDNGGDIGNWKKGDLTSEIENIVWDKERNYVTDPVKIDSGFLILKVLAHHQAGLAHLEEVNNEISNILFGPRFQPLVREYLTELRQQAFLEIKDGFVDTAAAPGKDTSWTDPAQLTPETITKEEVSAKRGRKRLLWLIPIPGTQRSPKSSSR